MIKAEKWMTISELGHRDLEEELKKAKEISLDLEEEVSKVRHEIKTMLKDLMKPLVEFHEFGIHLDFKLKNLIVFEKTEEEDKEEVEEELPKMEEKKAKKEKSKLMKMFHRKNKAEEKAKEEKKREEKEREEKEREEKERVEKEREEKERTKTIKWEEKVIKLIGSDAPVFYLDEQKKEIVKKNFSGYPSDFTAPELLEHLSYGKLVDVEVTQKMDIWSAGLIILQLTLTKTFGYKETDKKVGELFRSAKLKFVKGIDGEGGEFKPDPKKLDLPEHIYECPRYFELEKDWPSKNWWDNYLTVIHDILTVWDKMPEIVFLSVVSA
ncbi:hypothetical protein niasHT_033126 [Heterodera trifolii]|uniref:Protein kinase domain-containing protein n=1 Tax=Heterodera trifolii TaxID=157864 RepID=A0ABD2HWT3_9BILA